MNDERCDRDRVTQIAGDFSIGSVLWPGLAKFIEEAGEAQQVAGKLIATRGEAEHWDGTNLRTRLVEELGDLQAAITFLIHANGLSALDVDRRSHVKFSLFCKWHREADSDV